MSSDRHNIEQLLFALFYRRSCPAPEMLGDYYLGRLPPGQRLVVAQHLRHCPHCTRELSFYGEENEEAISGPVAWLHRAVSRVRWAMAAPKLLPTPAVRGAPYIQQAYQADSTQIVIETSPARVGYRRLDLIGQIQPAEAANDVELWDANSASTVAIHPVDEMGYFEFRQLPPGDYFLCLRAGEVETWLGQVTVVLPDT
jgi:anti-sigma factor RsiW